VEVLHALLDVFDELLDADGVGFVVLDDLLAHLGVELAESGVVGEHGAALGGVVVVVVDFELLLLVVQFLVPLSVDCLLLVGLLPGLLVVCLAVKTRTLVHHQLQLLFITSNSYYTKTRKSLGAPFSESGLLVLAQWE